MSDKRERIAAAELIEDFGLYPRTAVDTTNISRIVEVIRAGRDENLRVVADRKSKRIVDGFHTRRAYIRVFGDESTIPIEWRDYANDAELYADACRLNVAHGKPITGSEHTHAVLRGVDNGLDQMALAEIFGIRPEKIAEIVKIRVGHISKPSARGRSVKKSSAKPTVFALKNSVRHLWGTNPEFTPEQVKAHNSGPGTPTWLMVKQVADYLEYGLMDLSDSRVIEQLDRLERLLAEKSVKV